jgi:hypothetical protein
MSETSPIIKDSLQGNNQSGIDYPLQLLKEALAEYLPFLSVEFVVCDICGDKLRVRDFAEHIEHLHFDPPRRTWSTGPKAGWRKKAKLYG